VEGTGVLLVHVGVKVSRKYSFYYLSFKSLDKWYEGYKRQTILVIEIL
jgi:hypothetical protein